MLSSIYGFLLECSSAGKSSCLLNSRSWVRIPPFQPLLTDSEMVITKLRYGFILSSILSLSTKNGAIGEMINTLDCGSSICKFDSYIAPQTSL